MYASKDRKREQRLSWYANDINLGIFRLSAFGFRFSFPWSCEGAFRNFSYVWALEQYMYILKQFISNNVTISYRIPLVYDDCGVSLTPIVTLPYAHALSKHSKTTSSYLLNLTNIVTTCS